jgi:hypothetical protein
VEDDRLAARACVVDEENGDDDDHRAEFQPTKELSSVDKHMHDAYPVSSYATKVFRADSSLLTTLLQHSVDLEVTITSSGVMNVGLFCPTSMISLQQAEDALETLRGELEGL